MVYLGLETRGGADAGVWTMNVNMNFNQLLSQVMGLLSQAVTIALALLVVSAVSNIYGFTIPHIPVLARDFQGLSWLLIGFAAWRHAGGRLL